MTYIKLFIDYLEAIEPLGDAERGRLFTALLQYAKTGEAPHLSGSERFIFPMMRMQVDRDTASFCDESNRISESRREAGRKGGLASAEKRSKNENSFAKLKFLKKGVDKGALRWYNIKASTKKEFLEVKSYVHFYGKTR